MKTVKLDAHRERAWDKFCEAMQWAGFPEVREHPRLFYETRKKLLHYKDHEVDAFYQRYEGYCHQLALEKLSQNL